MVAAKFNNQNVFNCRISSVGQDLATILRDHGSARDEESAVSRNSR
jgi:hypothetical protein